MQDGNPHPFNNGRPGQKWWSLLKKRNPRVCLHTPEKLQLAWAMCSNPESCIHGIGSSRCFLRNTTCLIKQHISEMQMKQGFLFVVHCTSGKALTICWCKNVQAITADTKEQITALCAVSASGETIPPMHIIPGMRFKYNPLNQLHNSVSGTYFGHSVSGWITAELFYSWIVNHLFFPRNLPFGQLFC